MVRVQPPCYSLGIPRRGRKTPRDTPSIQRTYLQAACVVVLACIGCSFVVVVLLFVVVVVCMQTSTPRPPRRP